VTSPAAAAPRTVSCPSCRAPVAWTEASRFRPFCSERCRLIDFGAWVTESYRVPAVETDEPEGSAL